jgi:hypothetical protein
MNPTADDPTAENGATLLQRALQANGIFCAASGAILVVAAPWLARVLGIPWPPAITVTGLMLLPYGLLLWRQARRTGQLPALGRVAIILDGLWVAGSVALLLGGWLPLTTAGKWAIALLADVVGLFAVVQVVGLRRMASG